MTEPHDKPAERRKHGVATQIAFPRLPRRVVFRTVQLDVQHQLVEREVEVDGPAADPHWPLSTSMAQLRDVEHLLVAPDLELAPATSGQAHDVAMRDAVMGCEGAGEIA